MLAYAILMTFLTGFALGVIATGAVLVYLDAKETKQKSVKRDDIECPFPHEDPTTCDHTRKIRIQK